MRDRLLKRLIADSRAGWEIVNRVERIERGARGWFRIDFEAMRQLGRHDLLALAFPEHYPNGVPTINVPLPTSLDTLPLFAEGVQP